jgi:ribosomal protein L3 glutamine methyltransferase
MIDPREVTEQLVTVRDYLRWGTSVMSEQGVFFGHGTDNAWDECLALLQGALHWPQALDAAVLDSRLLPAERARVVAFVLQRVEQRLPLPYITGRAWFAGLPFKVDRRAIVPRSPLAELIEQGMQPWYGGPQPPRVLDLCAGSGCIGIAAAVWLPGSVVDLVDIDPEVLALAEENIALHGVGDRVRPIVSDLFEALTPGRDCYDLILSNPPYVDARDLAELPPEFRHEPMLALAAGEDGLDCARRILRGAVDYLAEDGVLVLEVGNSAPALEEAFPDLAFTWVELERGGEGVMVATAAELRLWRDSFR